MCDALKKGLPFQVAMKLLELSNLELGDIVQELPQAFWEIKDRIFSSENQKKRIALQFQAK